VIEEKYLSAGWGEKWPAPAKLNLMLRIVGRREDGYHLLQTVFQIIDMCDWLTFYPSEDGRVGLAAPTPGVREQDDLVVRAVSLLKAYTGYQGGVVIALEKNLPMGGGLGGGSSDAATVLLVLNKLWGLGLSEQELSDLGLRLGADVPVFIFGRSAWGEGVGESLREIDLPEKWYVIIKPDCHVNTGLVFSSEGLTRDSKNIKIDEFIAGNCVNDCEVVVRAKYYEVNAALDALSSFSKARLTGTGACVFAVFDSKTEAYTVSEMLKSRWSVFVAKGCLESPLHAQLKQLI